MFVCMHGIEGKIAVYRMPVGFMMIVPMGVFLPARVTVCMRVTKVEMSEIVLSETHLSPTTYGDPRAESD